MNVGKVVQIIGPVVDVEFSEESMPPIYNALRITSEGFKVPQPIDITAEVEQHLGEGRVRCVAMEPTDGMVRGMKAIDTGAAIKVPVGDEVLGRVIIVLGRPVDRTGDIKAKEHLPIHRPAPTFEQQNTKLEMFETGIKVIDLIEPYLKGGPTATEYRLLEFLMRRAEAIVTRDQLAQHVWGGEYDPMSNNADVYVGYIRRKLLALTPEPLIHTVRGLGYMLKREGRG